MACNSWASDAGCVQIDGCPDYCSGITNTQLHAGGDGCAGQVVITHGLAAYGDMGSGRWYWDASQDKADANLGTIIDPSVAFSLSTQGTGSGTGCWVREYLGAISVKWFGAVGDGITDDKQQIQSTIDFLPSTDAGKVYFPTATYYVNGAITIGKSGIDIDLNGSTISFDGASTGFIFGTVYTDDTISITDLSIHSGVITNDNETENVNRLYVAAYSVKYMRIYDLRLEYVSNGGIYIRGASNEITIRNIDISGASGYSTCRGVWITGDAASDYAVQVVDESAITRNATAFSVYKPHNILVENVNVVFTNKGYGIYLMSTQSITISNCNVDIAASPHRCIAINNHSPGAKVLGCTLSSSSTASGILVTQASDDVTIANNTFLGTFTGGRDIYVNYLSKALIVNNVFGTGTNKKIQIDMGAHAHIMNNIFESNSFVSGQLAIDIFTIALSQGAGTLGDTATETGEVYIEHNTFRNLSDPIKVTQQTSNGANVPGMTMLVVENNIAHNMDERDGDILLIDSISSANEVNVSIRDNKCFPIGQQHKVSVNDANGYANIIDRNYNTAMFLIDKPVSGEATTTSYSPEAGISLYTSDSGTGLSLVARSNYGAGSASKVFGVIPTTSNMGSFKIPDWSQSSPVLHAYDHSDVEIDLSTASAVHTAFMIVLSYRY